MIDTWFASVDLTIISLLFVFGVVLGATVLGSLPTARVTGPWAMAFFVGALGLVFFGCVLTLRAVENLAFAERTIGTGFTWLMFSFGTGLGARVRR